MIDINKKPRKIHGSINWWFRGRSGLPTALFQSEGQELSGQTTLKNISKQKITSILLLRFFIPLPL